MRHNLITLNDANHKVFATPIYSSLKSNKSEIKKMKHILHTALINELTLRQRECITMYYYEKKNMKVIASELSLSVPTVSKHIKAAKVKLKNIAKYYDDL